MFAQHSLRRNYPSRVSDGEPSTNMTPEDRDHMVELCKRIARETDPRKLAPLIRELNEVIQSKIRELRVRDGLPEPR